jgi:tRNA-Thr(GGU) m(6)t(6)A37 methyltransferase TsaA
MQRMTNGQRWFRMQSIGVVVREDQPPPDAFLDPAKPSTILVDERWQDGLAGIEEFSHLVVLFAFDRATRRRTAGGPIHPDGRDDLGSVGFFSTRTPKRPNPIGICCPKLIGREGRALHVTGMDAWDGTPVLDIKGYFPRDEQRCDAQVPQWLTELWRTHDQERTEIAPARERRIIEFTNGIVELREPNLGDIESATIGINALSAEQTFIMFQGEIIDEERERDWILGRMNARAANTGVSLMAVAGDRIVGGSQIDRSVLASRHVGDLGIAIAKDWRGIGLGRALMTALIDEARTTLEGLRLIRLDVFETNDVARSLYKSLGFVEIGRTPGAIYRLGRYEDSIQMALDLTT